jgi:anti-sigma regulatory factor (Ser/Thr protein kinase)
MIREIQYTFPSDQRQFGNLYRAIDSVGRQLEMSVEEQFRFAVCITEAYTNAFLHGNQQDPNKSILVRISWDEQTVRVDIEDEGRATVDQIDLDKASPCAPMGNTTGRGIGIMKKYADRIKIEQRQEGGIRVSIFWTLTRSSTNSVTAG